MRYMKKVLQRGSGLLTLTNQQPTGPPTTNSQQRFLEFEAKKLKICNGQQKLEIADALRQRTKQTGST
uniref:Uncharacterized protein n=1 Tax=Romanomermis culicivorax TaxID=13658 RepID=A0A915HEI4_ROMCU